MNPTSSPSSPIRFGTAGIRGHSESFITEALAAKVACALSRDSGGTGDRRVVVTARDTREHGDKYARAAGTTFSDHGLEVHDIGIACSGLVCNYVREVGAAWGFYVTGSHLPEGQIGLIAVDHDAIYVGAEDARRIEGLISSECPKCRAPQQQRVNRAIKSVDPRPTYRAMIRRRFPDDIKGVHIALDPAGGSAAGFANSVLTESGARVTAIHDSPTPHFPREPEPRARTLRKLRDTLLSSGADLAAGYDIDADRVYFFDEKGEGVAEDVVGAIFAARILKRGDSCVAPVNSSTLIEDVCAEVGARFEHCRIGQPEIVRAMKKANAAYAYEESGKYYLNGLPYADSIAATIGMARIVKEEGALSAIVAKLPKLHKWTNAVECQDRLKANAMKLAVEQAPHSFPAKPYRYVDLDGFKIVFRDGSWVMLRESGTEALLRVYSEAREEPRARAFGEKGKDLLERCVAEAGRATA